MVLYRIGYKGCGWLSFKSECGFYLLRALSKETDYKKLRKSFRKETSKLDRYLRHGKIEDYFKSPEGVKDAARVEDLAKKRLKELKERKKKINEGT